MSQFVLQANVWLYLFGKTSQTKHSVCHMLQMLQLKMVTADRSIRSRMFLRLEPMGPRLFFGYFLLSEIHHKLVNEIVALVVTHHLALPDPFLRTALGRTSTLELHHLARCLEVRARTLELHHLAHSLEACACGTTSIFIVVSALLHLA